MAGVAKKGKPKKKALAEVVKILEWLGVYRALIDPDGWFEMVVDPESWTVLHTWLKDVDPTMSTWGLFNGKPIVAPIPSNVPAYWSIHQKAIKWSGYRVRVHWDDDSLEPSGDSALMFAATVQKFVKGSDAAWSLTSTVIVPKAK